MKRSANIDPTVDVVFKKAFSDTHVATSFIKALLYHKFAGTQPHFIGECLVTEVPDGASKDLVMNVRVKDTHGNIYMIEMQVCVLVYLYFRRAEILINSLDALCITLRVQCPLVFLLALHQVIFQIV